MKRIALYASCVMLAATFSACHKDDTTTPVNTNDSLHVKTGVAVLCEGKFGAATSTVSFYDSVSATVDQDYFKTKNGYDLGPAANDMERYGNKIYITVTGTQGSFKSAVEILDATTFKSLARISFGDGSTTEYMPRNVVFSGAKAYVSCYDGTVRRIDTASMKIDGTVQAGGACEELTVANGQLYVTNSDNFQYPYVTPSTVSIIDISTFTKKTEINVAYNPNRIVTAGNGDVYAAGWGSYGSSTLVPALTHISVSNNTVVPLTNSYNINSMTAVGNKIYMIGFDNTVTVFDVTTNTAGASFVTDGTATTPYRMTYNPKGGNYYLADETDYSTAGKMYVYSSAGALLYSFTTGVVPQHAVFLYK
jgi:hypothetical protein